MFQKLLREIGRLGGATDRQEVVDHGLNVAMTAWHLTDWAWKDIQGSNERMRGLQKIAGRTIRSVEEFRCYIRKDSADIAYCVGIAVSTKHFGSASRPAFQTTVTTAFKVSDKPFAGKGGGVSFEFSPTGTKISYTANAASLWIEVDGSQQEAAKVFKNAADWWATFLKRMGIAAAASN
jgi:hypothetical protein